jgi:hypothetical protein
MPLQPAEIRINNVILYNGELLTVHSYDFANLDWSKAEGIGLTGEILEKCGFEKVSTYYKHMQDKGEANFRLAFRGESLHISVGDDKVGVALVIIKHLHQLQNFFFILTGEEIQVNL